MRMAATRRHRLPGRRYQPRARADSRRHRYCRQHCARFSLSATALTLSLLSAGRCPFGLLQWRKAVPEPREFLPARDDTRCLGCVKGVRRRLSGRFRLRGARFVRNGTPGGNSVTIGRNGMRTARTFSMVTQGRQYSGARPAICALAAAMIGTSLSDRATAAAPERAPQHREGIWKAAVPPKPMRAEFAGFDPVGIAAGVRIKADCSLNWVNPDDGARYCFSSGTSLEYFLDRPHAMIERARESWRRMAIR